MGDNEEVKDGIDEATKRIMAGLTFKKEDTPPSTTGAVGVLEAFLEDIKDFGDNFDGENFDKVKGELGAKLKAAAKKDSKDAAEESGYDDGLDWDDWGDAEDSKSTPPPPLTKKKKQETKKAEDPCAAKLADKDEAIAFLQKELAESKRDLAKAAQTNLALMDEVSALEDAAFHTAAQEGAIVPPGMTYQSYFEQLEGKIAAFKDFLMNTDYAMHKQHDRSHHKCRKCGHVYFIKQEKDKRLTQGLHYPTCPLYKALAK